MVKVIIIGHSGSGKSTMAKFLGQYYHCNVLHLDKIHFTKNWKERTSEEMNHDISAFMLQNRWIIEGNYTHCLYEERLKEADHIIYFNFNRFNCFYRAFKRYLKYKGQTRPDMADGCKEKFDFPFIKWILVDGRSKKKLKTYKIALTKYPQKTIILKTQKQSDYYLNSLESSF